MTKSWSSKYGRSLRLAALVGFLCLSCSPAQAASYGVNLIINGNAEQGTELTDWRSVASPNPGPRMGGEQRLHGGEL